MPPTTYTYTWFQPPADSAIALKADEYDPPQPGTHPVLLLVHGGGWAKGCRYSMDGVGYSFATLPGLSPHFISISIDYRLACNPADPDIQGSEVLRLCGWNYSTIDPQRGIPGAAIIDVQDAVAWVRNQWGPQHSSIWNQKIAVLGGSAGGNVSLMAVTLAPGGSASRPDAYAGLSPFPRFTLMQNHGNTVWGCDPGQSNQPVNCSIGELGHSGYYEAGLNRYLPCPNIVNAYDPSCLALYKAASPWDVVDVNQIYPPPTYVANGGGPDAGVSPPELAALQAAQDFNDKIDGFAVHRLCIVNRQDHGTRLLPDSCNDDPAHSVRQSVDSWLATYVCDLQHVCSG